MVRIHRGYRRNDQPGILTHVAAAGYPSRPVTLIVNCTPSGPSDMLARVVGRQMEKVPGRPFVIDNRAGGAGNVVTESRPCGSGVSLAAGSTRRCGFAVGMSLNASSVPVSCCR
jgi:tripartite-type tricarboxylate transporter receptor subunit TctC